MRRVLLVAILVTNSCQKTPTETAVVDSAATASEPPVSAAVVEDAAPPSPTSTASGSAPPGTSAPRPARPPDFRVEQLAVSDQFACARYTAGAVWCAGMNGVGQLGRGIDGADDPKMFDIMQPRGAVDLAGPASQIATGRDHACALVAEKVYCWGIGGNGELGWGPFRANPSPQRVLDIVPVTSIAAGSQHTCAVLRDGMAVACWGANQSGQLGDGTKENAGSPVFVKDLTGVKQIALGGKHSCALKSDGAVACWGSTGPLKVVAGLPRADEIAASTNATCARSGGDVRCWGGGYGAKPTVQKHLATAIHLEGGHNASGSDLFCAIIAGHNVACITPTDAYKITNDEAVTKTYTVVRALGVGGRASCYVRDDPANRIDCDVAFSARAFVEQL